MLSALKIYRPNAGVEEKDKSDPMRGVQKSPEGKDWPQEVVGWSPDPWTICMNEGKGGWGRGRW